MPENKPSLVARAVDGMQNVLGRLGIGTANVSSGSNYSAGVLTSNRDLLENMYSTSWIAGKVIDAPAEDMTAEGVTLGGIDPEVAGALEGEAVALDMWSAVTDWLRWSRLYGGAALLIQIDGQDPSTELRLDTLKKGSLRQLIVRDRWDLEPSTLPVGKPGRDYGQPLFYIDSVTRVKWHHSRVLRGIGQRVPRRVSQRHDGWGESILQRLYDRLVAADSTTIGAAQLVYKAYLRTVKVKGLRNILATGGKLEEALIRQFEYVRMMQTNEGLTLIDAEDDFNGQAYSFSGLDSVLIQIMQQVSGASDIPLVRLLGQSPAGLGGTGEADMQTYYDGVMREQETELRPALEFLYRLLHLSAIGTPAPVDMTLEFPSLWDMSDFERAELANKDADTVTKLVDAGIYPVHVAMREIKTLSAASGRGTHITDEMITEAENEPPPVPVETVLPGTPGDPNAVEPDDPDAGQL